MDRSGTHYALSRLLADVALTELSLVLATIVRPLLPFGRPLTEAGMHATPLVYGLIILIWAVVFLLLRMYEPRQQRTIDEAQATFIATTLATLTLASVLYFSYREVSRLLVATFYGLDVVLLVGSRLFLRTARNWAGVRPYGTRRVLILGTGEGGRDVTEMVEKHRQSGLEPVGFLDDAVDGPAEIGGYPVLGRLDQVSQIVATHKIDEVVVALPLQAYDRFVALLDTLQALPVQVRIVPEHIKTTFFRTRVEDLAGVPMITLQRPALAPFERNVKRLFDVVLGIFFLLVSLPLQLIVAAAIAIDSRGPVVFRQRRVGENGVIFHMFKFRSMFWDGEQQEPRGLPEGSWGLAALYKRPNDPRVTRVGRFIRRTSLDELPQLLNVIKGDMSIVGPRPELPFVVRLYEPWQWQRFAVPQGLTGWWQVNGRADKPMYLHTEDDLYYIQNYTLLLDLEILWRTVGAVLNRQGAF